MHFYTSEFPTWSDYLFVQEKLEKMRQQLSRMEAEKRSVQEELGRAEQRATKLELQRMSLDGDMQRLQMVLQEKEACVKVITFYTLFSQNIMSSFLYF